MNLYLCGLRMEVHGKKAKRNLRENSKHIFRFTIKKFIEKVNKVRLDEGSVRWAIGHIRQQRDTDLFPKLKEYDYLLEDEEYLVAEILKIDIENYVWQPYRRFIIPKDEYSYRAAIQLDPIDNLIMVAITHQFGKRIEDKRVPISENKVFNYRFSPKSNGELYDKKEAWKNFWSVSKEKGKEYGYVVYIDIADFYNRIYHHTLENQLIDCGFENSAIKAITNMLKNTTQTTSQGIPVGPHSMHLYAEMCLIALDDSLNSKGYNYCRYSDDILVFVDTVVQGQIVIYELAKMLDSLKLNMQRHKTKIYTKNEFQKHCDEMLNDNPINELEAEMIDIIKMYTADPYATIEIDNINDIDKEVFSEERIESILMGYLQQNKDYQRIRWLFRRLSSVGVGTAVNIAVREMDLLMPAISDVALYFASVADGSQGELNDTGEMLLELLKRPIISSNEFFQITILNLFANTNKFNHISKLIGMYGQSTDFIKRELILAGRTAEAKSWIREIKQDFQSLGIWSQRALIMASELLMIDERKYFNRSAMKNQNNLAIKVISRNITGKKCR